MKKNYLMMAAFATALAFTACSNEDEMPVVNGGNGTTVLDPESVIEIAISNTGTGTTRAARPLGSSEAWNNVDKVQLKVYQDGSEATVKFRAVDETGYAVTEQGLVTFKPAADKGPGENSQDRVNQTAKIQLTELAVGTYTIVAYGWNGDTFPHGTPALSDGKFSTGTINTTATGFEVEEVFAGSATATAKGTTTVEKNPNETGGTSTNTTTIVKFSTPVKIELTRQVAGMLAYFKNVPAKINGQAVTKLTVEAISEGTGFYYPADMLTGPNQDEFNGISNNESTVTLLQFTFDADQQKATTTEIIDGVACEIYDFTKGDTQSSDADGMEDADMVPENMKTLDNTLFGARYLIPFEEHIASGDLPSTMVVRLYTGDNIGDELKVKTDKAPQTPDGITSAYTFYDIRRNNFYSIGRKLDVEGTGTPGGGGPEDDEAVSLISGGEITLNLLDAWKVVHQMDVD